MEDTGRTPVKQEYIRNSLTRLQQVTRSKAYKNIEDRILSGTHLRNTTQRNKNRSYLLKKRKGFETKLISGTPKEKSIAMTKLKKITGLEETMNSDSAGRDLSVFQEANNAPVSSNVEETSSRLEGMGDVPTGNNEGELDTAVQETNVGQTEYSTFSNPTQTSPTETIPPKKFQIKRPFPKPEIIKEGHTDATPTITYAEDNLEGRPIIEKSPSIQKGITPKSYDDEFDELKFLKNSHNECKRVCNELAKQINVMESDIILPYELTTDSKLIDLLEKVILHPEWKERISNLIHISTSAKGNRLRGGSYFEAIFQLAIAIGALPEFKSKYVRFYDVSGYKALVPLPNYLHTKPVKNEGSSETGISDITFEVSNKPFEYTDSYTVAATSRSDKYECGSVPATPVLTEGKNPLYFISVKRFLKGEKSAVKSYDIPILDQQVRSLGEVLAGVPTYIMVGVKDRDKFLSNLSRTRIDFIKNAVKERVIGYDELLDAFSDYRLSFFNKTDVGFDATPELIKEKILELYPKQKTQKPILSLYFHQELVVQSVMNRLRAVTVRDKPHFMCVGVLPRGGKSFIAGGIIDSHKRLKQKTAGYNILFLTSAINETRDQFKKDLIEMFTEFDDFNFIDVVIQKGGGDHITGTGSKKNNFYFVSRQLSSLKEPAALQQHIDIENPDRMTSIGEPDILQRLERKLGKRPDFDICFFDEAHVGIKSGTVRKTFQKTFEQYKMPIILMTATYKNPARILDSALDLFVWDLQDIKDMKGLPKMGLEAFLENKPDIIERYPILSEKILRERLAAGQTEEQLAKPYINFPNPNFISLTFTPETIANLLKDGGGYNHMDSFNINQNDALLSDSSQNKNWHSLLANKEHAVRLREFLTPVREKRDDGTDGILIGKDRKYRALNQIFTIAQENGGRPMQSKPFSILMFMPIGNGPIGELCRIWASFMYQSSYWSENFVFLTLSVYAKHKRPPDITYQTAVNKGICHREDFDDDLKSIIINIEREALKQSKGLVILSGDVAKMGISLPCVDVVFLMSSNPDPDDIIQKMYRALTDNPPYKKDGFIVDLDIKRIIKAMFDYDLEKDRMRLVTKKTPTTEQRLMKTFELCNWGQDAYIEDNPQKSFDDIMNEIKNIVISRLSSEIISEYDNKFKQLETNQIKIINDNDYLRRRMNEVLSMTGVTKKGKKGQGTVLNERGAQIPSVEKKGDDNEQPSTNAPPPAAEPSRPLPPPTVILTPAEIEAKMKDIVKTYVNTLVIRSTEPWSGSMNIAALLKTYREDMATSKWPVQCNCTTEDDCRAEHNNLYDAVACELKVYAYTNSNEYSEQAHKGILELVDRIFDNSTLIVEWNIYIERLLRDMGGTKVVPSQNGGVMHFRRRTRKISRK